MISSHSGYTAGNTDIQRLINGNSSKKDEGFFHGMGLRLGQSLVGHSPSLCSLFVPVFLVGRRSTNFGLQFVWVVGVLISSLGLLPNYRRWTLQAPYPPFLGVSARVILIDSLGPLLLPRATAIPVLCHAPHPHPISIHSPDPLSFFFKLSSTMRYLSIVNYI